MIMLQSYRVSTGPLASGATGTARLRSYRRMRLLSLFVDDAPIGAYQYTDFWLLECTVGKRRILFSDTLDTLLIASGLVFPRDTIADEGDMIDLVVRRNGLTAKAFEVRLFAAVTVDEQAQLPTLTLPQAQTDDAASFETKLRAINEQLRGIQGAVPAVVVPAKSFVPPSANALVDRDEFTARVPAETIYPDARFVPDTPGSTPEFRIEGIPMQWTSTVGFCGTSGVAPSDVLGLRDDEPAPIVFDADYWELKPIK